MMSSSINERTKALKNQGHRIVKLMAYAENDYDRIVALLNATYKNVATFTSTTPTSHLPYSKGGMQKFT